MEVDLLLILNIIYKMQEYYLYCNNFIFINNVTSLHINQDNKLYIQIYLINNFGRNKEEGANMKEPIGRNNFSTPQIMISVNIIIFQ